MEDLKKVEERLDTQKRGVFVQASTLGSLEALLDFLRSQKVSKPRANVSCGVFLIRWLSVCPFLAW